jgi:hypothetical protein
VAPPQKEKETMDEEKHLPDDCKKMFAEEMKKKYSNTKVKSPSQTKWLVAYWKKCGHTTDTRRMWNVPGESDESGWDDETWASWVD